jgi:DNA-binding response OmpR family regulator
LAEDERDMSAAIAAVLAHFDYEVDTVYDGLAAMDQASKRSYDCMVFDIMMPKMDGIEALKKLRQSGDVTPVIMLTAKAEVDDRITGLDSGADDYLTKPFAMGELLARIRSMTRREQTFNQTRLSAGTVDLDVEEQELSCKSSIRLSNKETKLMKLFMLNEGKHFGTDTLAERIWKEEDDVDSSIVWVYISYLREKLDAIGADVRIMGHKDGDFFLTTENTVD